MRYERRKASLAASPFPAATSTCPLSPLPSSSPLRHTRTPACSNGERGQEVAGRDLRQVVPQDGLVRVPRRQYLLRPLHHPPPHLLLSPPQPPSPCAILTYRMRGDCVFCGQGCAETGICSVMCGDWYLQSTFSTGFRGDSTARGCGCCVN
eukprot:895326-Rhodomonas_salina.1